MKIMYWKCERKMTFKKTRNMLNFHLSLKDATVFDTSLNTNTIRVPTTAWCVITLVAIVFDRLARASRIFQGTKTAPLIADQ